ncbi:MAG TPA: hypothetical protein PK325_16755, partial [Cyclobacteriaceae bacterium]|nr:hypothetical protein [Cyclobacteriaceae bacterium]
SKSEAVLETFRRIDAFAARRQFIINRPESFLHNQNLEVWLDSDMTIRFTFDHREPRSPREVQHEFADLVERGVLQAGSLLHTTRKNGFQKIETKIVSQSYSGELNSLAEGTPDNYQEHFLRYIQPINTDLNVGLISTATDLMTDQEIRYAVGIVDLKTSGFPMQLFRISHHDQQYLVLDCQQRADLQQFENCANAVLTIYAFIWGNLWGKGAFILSSHDASFNSINAIQFHSKPDHASHRWIVFDPWEIRHYQFHSDFFQFPVTAFEGLCNRVISEDKFRNALKIIYEANTSPFSLSTCILFCTALEILANLVPSDVTQAPIDAKRYKNSNIETILANAILQNDQLTAGEQEFLIQKKLPYLNKPTNIDKLQRAFEQLNITNLPDKFKKAIRYRDKYLHGSAPKPYLSSTEADTKFKAFELQFLANILVLKLAGYRGFLKNYSAEMELHFKRNLGMRDEGIDIDHSLYYTI